MVPGEIPGVRPPARRSATGSKVCLWALLGVGSSIKSARGTEVDGELNGIGSWVDREGDGIRSWVDGGGDGIGPWVDGMGISGCV